MRLQCIQDLPWHRLFLTKNKNQTVAIIQQAWTTNAQDRKTDQSMWEMTVTYTSCLCVSTSLHSRNDEISCSTDLWAVTRYFCLIKCSLRQIRWLKSHKFWPCHGRETWQAARCSLINHCLQFMMCEMSPARERSSLTTTTDKSSWKVNKKIKHVSRFVMRRPRRGVSCCPLRHTTQDEMIDCCSRWSLIVFRAHPAPDVFPVRLLSDWYCVVWPRR